MTLSDFDFWYRSRYSRTSSALTTTAMIIADFIGIMLSFGLGFFIVKMYYIFNDNWGGIVFKSFVTYWPYIPAFIILFQFNNLYPGVSLAPAEEFRKFVLSSFIAHGGILISKYVYLDDSLDSISIAFIISFFCSTFVFLICRDLMHNILYKTRLGGIPAVIFGGGITGRMLVDRLIESEKAGYVPILILDEDRTLGDSYREIPIIHDTSIGPELVKRFNIKMAIVTNVPNMNEIDRICPPNNSVSAFRYHVLIPNFFINIWMTIRDFDGILGFVTSHELKKPWNLGIKRFMDITVSLSIGFILLPILLCIALLVKITSPGPVLYGHKRLGLNGKYFKAYKFRSMVIDADKRLRELLDSNPQAKVEWETNHKIKNDPRVTKLGKILRLTSLDEFPQLINILKGEMSLVGPRPIVDDEVEKYGVNFAKIFSVKPGLSGLWQVSGRSDTDYNDRVFFDTYYLQSWSVWLDFWILYKTFWVVIKGKGAY